MTQTSDAVANAMLDAGETAAGTAPILTVRTGPPPANCAAANAGTVLATLTLPADWMAAAGTPTARQKAKSGTWQGSVAAPGGKPSHYRIHNSAGTTCHFQGIAAGPWLPGTVYAAGDHATNDAGKVYKCTTGGTSAGAGGPTGTGTGIADGTAVWAYVQAAADMVLDSGVWTTGQTFTVTQYTLIDNNG